MKGISAFQVAWLDILKIPRQSALFDMMRYPRHKAEDCTPTFGGRGYSDTAARAVLHSATYRKTYGIDPALAVTRAEMVRHELLRVMGWENGDSLYGLWGRPTVDRDRYGFLEEAISRGWLRVEDGLLYSTGLGRCIAELHNSWRD